MFIILQILFATRMVLKIGEYPVQTYFFTSNLRLKLYLNFPKIILKTSLLLFSPCILQFLAQKTSLLLNVFSLLSARLSNFARSLRP